MHAVALSGSPFALGAPHAGHTRRAPCAAPALALRPRGALVASRSSFPSPCLSPLQPLRAPARTQRLRARPVAAAGSADEAPQERALAPVMPVSPVGDFLSHMLSLEPHLFDGAVDAQLERMADEAESEAAASAGAPGGTSELTLYQRIGDVKRRARSQSVQDLMYFSVLRKFISLGVDLLPPLDGKVPVGNADLGSLTKGVHSLEALELVREHLEGVLGGGQRGGEPFSNAMIRMSKLQAAQVYAASLMFGYFLRRVDSRFQLERQMGSLPRSAEESVKALEDLFNSATAADPADPPPSPGLYRKAGDGAAAQPAQPAQPKEAPAELASRKASLRRYVETFDAETLSATARIVSMEGVALVERQTTALFGSVEALSTQMTEAIGSDVQSREDFMARMQEAIATGKVENITLPYITQRRLVLESVAFGSFLRDVEARVGAENAVLLTPTPGTPGM